MKKLTALLLASMIFVLGGGPVACGEEAAAIDMLVDGFYVSFGGHEPTLDNGATMLPVRYAAEALGLKYSWYPQRGTAVLSDGAASVELVAGQRVIEFGGSVFIADRDISVTDGELCVSGAAMLRLAEGFGYNAALDGGKLTVDTKDFPSLVVNGDRLDMGERSYVRDVWYIPLMTLTKGLGLEYYIDVENRSFIIDQSGSGRGATLSYGGEQTEGPNFSHNDEAAKILYDREQLYMDSDSVLGMVEYFGGAASYSRYKNNLLISWDRPLAVKVNGVLTVFPDVQPSAEAIPLRFPMEAAGMDFDAGEDTAVITSADGASVTLTAGEDRFEVVSGGRHTSGALDTPPAVADERLTVTEDGLRLIAEALGLDFSSEAGLIELTDPAAEPFVPVTPEKPITVELDGRTIVFPDAEPVVIEGRTLIPVRAVAEEMDMKVTWLGDSASIESGGDSLLLTIGSDVLTGTRGGEAVSSKLDVPAAIIDNRTCVPIRAVMEFFGAAVDWDAESRTVKITSPVKPKVITTVPVKNKEEFVIPLGFTIDAPIGAADVEYGVANRNTALVRYRTGNTVYSFSASIEAESAVLEDRDFVGPRLSHRSTVNGVPTSIVTGTVSGGPAARWEIGAYKFSLSADTLVDSADLYNEALSAAGTFVIVRETEPEPEEKIDFDAGMTAAEAELYIDLEAAGVTASAPYGSTDVNYLIWDGRIAEVDFVLNGRSYVLRGAVNGGALFPVGGVTVDEDTAIAGGSTASVRRMSDGSLLGSWNVGRAEFMLYSGDGDLSFQEFKQVCGECGLICYEVSE